VTAMDDSDRSGPALELKPSRSAVRSSDAA
jgi:hypothetical protein